MITTSVRGHLATTDFPKDFGWSRVDPIQLFDAPLEVIYSDDMKPLQTMLSRLSRDVGAVILWLDCDREGEAIADEVRQVCIEANRDLEPFIYRARFSTVLDAEIRRALQNLGRLNEWFIQAVHARSQLDLRVGAAFTRFQTLRLQKKFQLSGNSVVSYGPCQFPTLGFVVERWARIQTFVPEDFWFIELALRIPGQGQQEGRSENDRPIHFTWKRNRLYDQLVTLSLYESCLEAQMAVVTQMNGRPKNKWRPVPLATVELQKRASRYLRIGSESLMQAAEALYQQGFISYPRTETERFRPEFQHQPLIQNFATMREGGDGPFAA
jgi:DNA topoisomerase-3